MPAVEAEDLVGLQTARAHDETPNAGLPRNAKQSVEQRAADRRVPHVRPHIQVLDLDAGSFGREHWHWGVLMQRRANVAEKIAVALGYQGRLSRRAASNSGSLQRRARSCRASSSSWSVKWNSSQTIRRDAGSD